MAATLDLISMADIARLAGEKRATVGNWKARNPDEFPLERGRGSRGPLYDRAEVIAWLEATNRLKPGAPVIKQIWNIADSLRGAMSTEDLMPLLLAMLAVKAKAPTAWRTLLTSTPSELGDAVRAAVHATLPFAVDVLPHGRLPGPALLNVLEMLAALDENNAGATSDALMDQAATAMGHRGGEFLTPRSIRQLMVAISQPTGTVYNPATGVGQLLIDAALIPHERPTQLFGQEINTRIWAMAKLNLALHDVEAEVALGDVFGDDHFPQLRADRVLCVPPWNQKLPMAEFLMNDPRWVFGEPGTNDGNAAWIQHCLAHLADDGRAVIALPNSVLFDQARAGRIRQRIVKAGLLDAVVGLPPGLFEWTGLPCALLVFRKGRSDVDGKPASTLMVDLTESEGQQTGRTSSLSDEQIDGTARIYQDWTQGIEPSSSLAAVATFDDLAANDFVIDPVRYLALPRTTPNVAKATRAHAELLERLASLTSASHDADAALQRILGGRG
jgi:type I restriction enzyme M protein